MLPLTLTDVTVRRRGKPVLGPLTHTLHGTGLTAVIGPNGSGKSTLLRVMHGIERLTSGTHAWAIPEIEARRHQAFVFQTPILLRRSVAENLRYPLRLTHQHRGSDTLIREMAARVGLSEHLEYQANRLSGGERQKLALARALITRPKVLFLDEPCANLDGHAMREIETLLAEVRDSGTRIVLATHDMGQARRLADDVIFLVAGQIRETGTTALTAPQTPQLRAFLQGDIVT